MSHYLCLEFCRSRNCKSSTHPFRFVSEQEAVCSRQGWRTSHAAWIDKFKFVVLRSLARDSSGKHVMHNYDAWDAGFSARFALKTLLCLLHTACGGGGTLFGLYKLGLFLDGSQACALWRRCPGRPNPKVGIVPPIFKAAGNLYDSPGRTLFFFPFDSRAEAWIRQEDFWKRWPQLRPRKDWQEGLCAWWSRFFRERLCRELEVAVSRQEIILGVMNKKLVPLAVPLAITSAWGFNRSFL